METLSPRPWRGIAEPFEETIPETVIPEIAKIPGVTAVSGQLINFAATDNDESVLAAGWEPNSPRSISAKPASCAEHMTDAALDTVLR